jgi:AbrB family looped-hinge helix DNA binding protein
MTLVKVRRDAQITLPRDIREAARLQEGDYLEAEVTESGMIVLKPVSIAGREPTPEQEAEILAAVDEARSFYANKRRGFTLTSFIPWTISSGRTIRSARVIGDRAISHARPSSVSGVARRRRNSANQVCQ